MFLVDSLSSPVIITISSAYCRCVNILQSDNKFVLFMKSPFLYCASSTLTISMNSVCFFCYSKHPCCIPTESGGLVVWDRLFGAAHQSNAAAEGVGSLYGLAYGAVRYHPLSPVVAVPCAAAAGSSLKARR